MKLSVERNVSLKALNSFGVEALATRFVRIESIEQLQELHASSEWSAGPRLVLGGGSNMLLTRDFEGLVILIACSGREVIEADDKVAVVRAAAGENWDALVRWTLAHGVPGLENLALIPGTVGAAPIQNIGAYGVELKERFHELEALDTTSGELMRLSWVDCAFAYRDSVFKNELRDRVIITSVSFRLQKSWQPVLDYGEIRSELVKCDLSRPTPMQVAEVVSAIRRAKLPDPATVGNAGSFFKNPIVSAAKLEQLKTSHPGLVSYLQSEGTHKLAAAWLVDQCGWKGGSLPGSNGRAAVHDRQALVLVNRGGASGSDILDLADAIREDVERRFGVVLDVEPEIV